jgi:hypothetical protein
MGRRKYLRTPSPEEQMSKEIRDKQRPGREREEFY